jgi:hypothetical protein
MAPSLLEEWGSTAEASGLTSLKVPVLRFRSWGGEEHTASGKRYDERGNSVKGQSKRRLCEWHELCEFLLEIRANGRSWIEASIAETT